MFSGDVLDDRFVLEEQVGRGGVGLVFRGWDLEAERAVAIKLLTRLTATAVQRFQREIQLLATTRTPGIVRHVHHGTSNHGTPYLVMEWLEGETVAKRMESIGFDVAESIALVRAVCAPLGVLHDQALVHRDLKPENLVLTGPRPSDVVVIDFGLARAAVETEDARITTLGTVLGTPGYSAPEQVRGERLDPRVDVFALGCLLYELLAGYTAFPGTSLLAVQSKILLTEPPDVPAVPPLRELVHRMLAKRPADRPAHARALDAELAALGELPAGPRVRWRAERPPTVTSRPATAVLAAASDRVWTGLLVLASNDPTLATRVAARDPQIAVERADAGVLVIVLPPNADLAPLARDLAMTAFTLQADANETPIAIATGREPLEALIDRAARVYDEIVKRTLSDGPFADVGSIYIEPVLVDALASEFIVDARAGRLLRQR